MSYLGEEVCAHVHFYVLSTHFYKKRARFVVDKSFSQKECITVIVVEAAHKS